MVGKVEALLPVIELLDHLKILQSELQHKPNVVIQRPQVDVQLPEDERSFKQVFDSFSDPVSYKQRFLDQNAFLVYYTGGFDGPGRPSIEETVNVKQTLQYGYRNEAWVSYDEFLSEWKYARTHQGELDVSDLVRPISLTITSIEAYINLAPAGLVIEGRRRLEKR
jgi:hypothetical protein